MQHYVYGKSLALQSCCIELEHLIRECLHTEWAIYIEYAEAHPQPYTNWKRWGEIFFAIKKSTQVLDSINACRSCFPGAYIRLYAEKFRPNTKLVYWVQSPDQFPLGNQVFNKENKEALGFHHSPGKHEVYTTWNF